MSEASCLCCGHVGTPKVSLIDRPEVYVCERCHRRSTLPMPEQGFSTEEEGDAYTHGWFDCNEAHRPSGVTVTNAWKAEQPITNAPRSISEPTAGVALPAAPIQLSAIESALFDALVSWHEISGIPADPAELERLASYLTVAVIESDPAPAGVKTVDGGRQS